MKKDFKSKIDLLLILPILVIILVAAIIMLVKGIVVGVIGLGILAAFIAYICRDTIYRFTTDNKLQVRSGFLYHREIYIKSIKKIRPTQDRSASPALSLDRIEICYNRYGRIVVSPDNKTEFIRHLKDVNPRIHVEENNTESFYQSVERRIEELIPFRRNN